MSKPGSNARRGGILSGLLFTFLACIALAVFAGLYLVRNVRVQTKHRNGGDDVSIETPGGRFDIRAHEDLDPAAVGVPIYPGATRTKDSGVATFEWSSVDGKQDKGVSVAGANLFTHDPSWKVLDYYRKQLPNWVVYDERGSSTRFELKKGGYKRIIAIRGQDDGTHIGVAAIGDPASN